MTSDHINALFELIGGMLLMINCWRMYKDKQVKGISVLPVMFFTTWGYWNLYFYPSVNAWWSFYGGIAVVFANTTWISMVFYYKWFAKTEEAQIRYRITHQRLENLDWIATVTTRKEHVDPPGLWAHAFTTEGYDKASEAVNRAEQWVARNLFGAVR